MKRFVLSRRTVLRGAGAALALPLLDAMLDSKGEALAAGGPIPKRFVTWFFGNGVINGKWKPAATGPTWALSSELAGLSNVKDYVNVVSGYDVKTPNVRGHHNGAAAILSGYPFITLPAGSANFSSKFGGPSIDQVAAPLIGQGTTFPSIQLAISKRVDYVEGPTLAYLSHKGPDSPLPAMFSPAAVFTKLFGSFTPKPAADPADGLRVSVLDRVKEDAEDLARRLGAADRRRLDAHLGAISELRQQILALPPPIGGSCQKPAAVANTNQDVNGREQLKLVAELMSDLLAMAFACDLTRVASFQFTGPVCDTVFSDLGQREGEHNLTHDSSQQGAVHDAVVYTVDRFAYLCEKLKGTVEGAGNVLDSSCLLLSTDVTEGLSHSYTDYPIVVAGRAGGMLRYPGIHHRGTGQNTSDVLLSCLRAVGAAVPSVGGGAGLSSTPCTAILA